MNRSGRWAYPERLSMCLKTCWRRRKTLAGYAPFDRKMDTSPRLPSHAITAQQFCSFNLGENLSGCSGLQQDYRVKEVRTLRELRRCENVPKCLLLTTKTQGFCSSTTASGDE